MRCVVFIFLLLPALVARVDETFKKNMLPTMCELTGQPVPKQSDGISFLPTLRGASKKQAKHDYLYFEFCTGATTCFPQVYLAVKAIFAHLARLYVDVGGSGKIIWRAHAV